MPYNEKYTSPASDQFKDTSSDSVPPQSKSIWGNINKTLSYLGPALSLGTQFIAKNNGLNITDVGTNNPSNPSALPPNNKPKKNPLIYIGAGVGALVLLVLLIVLIKKKK